MNHTGHQATGRQADGRHDRPAYLTLVRPRCPGCNSPRLLAYKSVKNGVGDDPTMTA